MTTVQFDQGSPQWHAYRKKALTDLYWLCDVVLGYGALVPMRPATHYLMCRFMERRTGEPALDEAPVRLILVPRALGKSTCCTQGYAIQAACRNPDTSLMLANEKEENAARFLRSIKQEFEANELLRALFPEVIPETFQNQRWSVTEADVKRAGRRKEPTFFVTGTGGTVTGMHPDEIIVDDMLSVDAMQNAKVGARQITAQLNDWTHTLPALVNTGARPHGITYIGTRWFHGDSYEHLHEYHGNGERPVYYNLKVKLPDGTTQTLQAYRQGDLAVFRRSAIEHGQSIFPEKWDLERLAKMRMADPVLFANNYMNLPSDDVTSAFKESWLRTYQWTEGNTAIRYTDAAGQVRVTNTASLDRLLIVDPGGFGTTQGAKGDRARAACILTGSTPDFQTHFVLKAYSERDTYLACIREVVAWVSQDQPRKVVVEQTGQQMAFVDKLREEMLRAGVRTPIETITPKNKDKDLRILELEPFFQQGQVYIGSGPQWLEFRQQYAQWPRAMRRDLLDVLAYGPVVWRKPQRGDSLSHEKRQRAEEARYLQMRYGR